MNSRFPLIAAVVACAAVFFLMVKVQRLERQLKPHPAATVTAAPAGGFEVAPYMGRIQTYANKLWSAGKSGNLPLADFYRHEIKEQMEEIAHAGVLDDGIDVSGKMEAYGLRTIEAMKQELKAGGLKDFDGQFHSLINTCNTCHVECNKPFLVVKVPTYTRYDDQDFTPVE